MDSLTTWVQTSAGDDFWPIAIGAAIIALFCFWSCFHFLIRKRVMEDTPTSLIRSAAQGYTELTGHGAWMAGDEHYGPLTGKSCTWFEFRIEEKRTSGKKTRWVTIDSGTSEALFLIIDETGNCVIDPDGASVTTVEKDVWYGSTSNPGSVAASPMLGIGGRYRYTEWRLLPEESLYAMGLFKTVGNQAEQSAINDDVKILLRDWKENSEQLLLKYDTNKDGEISMEEWQTVREDALKQVMADHKDRQNQPAVNMLIRTNDRRRPFLLSAVAQHDLIKRYRLYSGTSIVVSFISAAFAFWAITLRLAGA